MTNKLVNKLADFLQLEREFRQAENVQGLGFAAVNLTRNVLGYSTAILLQSRWRASSGSSAAGKQGELPGSSLADLKVHSVSGSSSFDLDAPLLTAVQCALGNVDEQRSPAERKIPYQEEILFGADHESLHAMVCELYMGGTLLGCLVLVRDQSWQEHETGMAAQVQHALAHSMVVHYQRQCNERPGMLDWISDRIRQTRFRWVALALLLLALLPVRQSVIAEGQVVPAAPSVIASGLNGVIHDVFVKPNQPVNKGDLLIRLDATELVHRKSRVQQELALAMERLRKAEQQSFAARSEPREGTAVFAELRAETELKHIELDYIEGLIERLEIRAPVAGVVLFSSPKDWLGRAVSTGEKIMEVAEEHDREFEIWLDASDAIALADGNQIKFFPDAFPLSSMDGAVHSVGYFANQTPDQTMAYRITASVEQDNEKIRMGMKGTARLYGDRILLGYYVMRKPLSTLRQFVGV